MYICIAIALDIGVKIEDRFIFTSYMHVLYS